MNLIKDWLVVMRRQWSWKNDRVSLVLSLLMGFISITLLYITGGIVVSEGANTIYVFLVLWFTLFTYITINYHILKFTIFSMYMVLVVYLKNTGNSKAIDIYNEALTWRQ